MPAWLKRKQRAQRAVVELKESQIEETCSAYLELDGWRTLKTDPVSNAARGKGFGEKGMADRLYIRYDKQPKPDPNAVFDLYVFHELLWIEWKRVHRGKATKAAKHQTDWHEHERLLGATTLIAGEDFPATIEGFQEFYRTSGLRRRVL